MESEVTVSPGVGSWGVGGEATGPEATSPVSLPPSATYQVLCLCCPLSSQWLLPPRIRLGRDGSQGPAKTQTLRAGSQASRKLPRDTEAGEDTGPGSGQTASGGHSPQVPKHEATPSPSKGAVISSLKELETSHANPVPIAQMGRRGGQEKPRAQGHRIHSGSDKQGAWSLDSHQRLTH